MQKPIKYTLIAVFLFNAVVVSSFAQTFSAKIKEMAKGADVILTGKIVKNESFWTENKSRIVTQSNLQVEEYIKGTDTRMTVQVLCPGGEVGDVGELYSHMPTFKKNEEVLVFLKKDQASASYKVFNGEDGKIPLLTDNATGEKITSTRMFINSLKEEIKMYINENK